MVTFNPERYEQFIDWLTRPERWTLPHFHLTDESHSLELKETGKQLHIDMSPEEMFWFVFLDACVDKPSTASELFKVLGKWSSVRWHPPSHEGLMNTKQWLRPGLVGNHRERAFAKKGARWVDRFAETVLTYIDRAASSQRDWLLGAWRKVTTENQHDFFDNRMEFLTRRPSKLPTFGRTTAFDYLERVGRLGLLDLDFRPDRMYLEQSSGPLLGFSIMLTGLPLKESRLKDWLRERGITTQLDELAKELQDRVLEDKRIIGAYSVSDNPRLLIDLLSDSRNFETSLCCFYEEGVKNHRW